MYRPIEKQKCTKNTGKERHAKQMQTNEEMEGINKNKKVLPLYLFTI